MVDRDLRRRVAVVSDEEFALFRLYWEEAHGIDMDDPPPDFVEEVTGYPRSTVEALLRGIHLWMEEEGIEP